MGHKLSILASIGFVFDSGQMARDRLGPDHDRLLVAQLDAIARRLARWGALTDGEQTGGVAELREVTGDRFDLLAEVAGIALGTSESKGPDYQAQAQAVAELCRMAGARECLIPQWIEEGRRRAAAAQRPPFSGGVRPLDCPAGRVGHDYASDPGPHVAEFQQGRGR
jgi:hypothetical protein